MDMSKRHLLTPFAGAIATALTPGQTVLAQSDDNDNHRRVVETQHFVDWIGDCYGATTSK